MADAGDIWFRALSGVGNNIADSMQQYHKEHQAYDQQAGIAQAMSRLGVNQQGQITTIDPENPDKTIQPLVDKKASEMFLSNNHAQQQKNLGAMEALNRIGMSIASQSVGPMQAAKLQQERAQATLYQKAVDQPFGRLGTGETVINTPHGASIEGGRGTASLTAEAGRAARFQANTALKARKDLMSQFATQFGQYGVDSPNEFLQDNLQAGNVDKKGVFTKLGEGETGGSHIRLGDDGAVLTKDQFIQGRRQAMEWQKLGQIGYGGLTGGKQAEPVKVATPDDARKLAPGTIYETPDGQQYQTPPQ